MKNLVIVLLLLGVIALSGCGQTGALYLPDEDSTPQKKPQN